jgi:hypothetical protein
MNVPARAVEGERSPNTAAELWTGVGEFECPDTANTTPITTAHETKRPQVGLFGVFVASRRPAVVD